MRPPTSVTKTQRETKTIAIIVTTVIFLVAIKSSICSFVLDLWLMALIQLIRLPGFVLGNVPIFIVIDFQVPPSGLLHPI